MTKATDPIFTTIAHHRAEMAKCDALEAACNEARTKVYGPADIVDEAGRPIWSLAARFSEHEIRTKENDPDLVKSYRRLGRCLPRSVPS